MNRSFLLALTCFCTLGLSAQFSPFQLSDKSAATQIATLDLAGLKAELQKAPGELTQKRSKVQLNLPLPSGGVGTFTAFDADLLPEHEALGSYKLTSDWGSGRIAISPEGMSAVLRGPDGYFIIQPSEDIPGAYQIVDYEDLMHLLSHAHGNPSCGYDEAAMPDYQQIEIGADAGATVTEKAAGGEARELRVYDLIMTNTGEFARNLFGTNATQEQVLGAFNEATSTVNAIFENEIGIRMNLVEVPGLIYLDPATDPYVNADEGTALLGQVIGAFTANNVSLDRYDLGHLFTARCNDVGGVVSGRACTPQGKTRGITCVSRNVVASALRIMAHEIAHQFAVSHTWNNCPGNEQQRAGNTAFEPGSGTTIMSYAGTCGSNNIGGEQSYYHVGSVEQFLRYTREGGAEECATVVETSNFSPEVAFDYEDGFYIPVSTPFRLEGSATDANDDNLTYNWEQFDLGPAVDIREPQGDAPLFRSLRPTEDGNVRYFPSLEDIVDGETSLGETLPTYERTLTFRLVARDNNAEAGGVDWKQVEFFTDEAAGPFLVDNPTDTQWRVGDYQEITWDVANTDKAPVNCKRVDLLLSVDGGDNFDITLATDVPNIGNAFVTVPAEGITDQARIMVAAADNVFLNVNSSAFSVAPADVPTFTLESSLRFQEICLPDVVTAQLESGSILDFTSPINLSVDQAALPEGVNVSFGQTTLVPGEATDYAVDLSEVRYSGLLNIPLLAVVNNDTMRRNLLLEVTDNDYSDLATILPSEGTTGVVLSTDFGWTDAANAETYDIQIASSPTFSEESLFVEAADLEVTDFTPEDFFAANTVYYWRVRPTNSCGAGDWTPTNSFRTVNTSCASYKPDDLPVRMPGNGPAFSRESTQFVEASGTISDLNLPNVNIRYAFASNITITLVSPAGTEVTVYKEKCFSSNLVDLGFDDEAPNEVSCPASDSRVFIPEESLAAFKGENTFGEWKLRVDVSETGGSAGTIENWEVEFCADINAAPPQSISNTATECPPGERSVILRERLEVTSTEYGSDGIIYTLTGTPRSGTLTLYGRELAVGDTFGQDDINGNGLFYVNTDVETEIDEFRFVVNTPDGGYLPVTVHDISIFEGAVVSTEAADRLASELNVFPNPTGGTLAIRWSTTINRDLELQLFNLNGQLLQRRVVNGATKAAGMDLTDLPAGVYLLRIDGAVRRVVKR